MTPVVTTCAMLVFLISAIAIAAFAWATRQPVTPVDLRLAEVDADLDERARQELEVLAADRAFCRGIGVTF